MRKWLRYFFGTPRRFASSMIALGLVVAMIDPAIVSGAISFLVAALSPLMGPVLAIVIVFAGLRMIVFGKR